MANISHKSKSGTVTLKLRRFYFNRTCLPDLDFRFLLLILQVKNKTQTNIIMEKTTVIRRIGLVAHDAKKKDLIEWVLWNSERLKGHKFYCTGTTGTLILEALKAKHPEVDWDFTILKS